VNSRTSGSSSRRTGNIYNRKKIPRNQNEKVVRVVEEIKKVEVKILRGNE